MPNAGRSAISGIGHTAILLAVWQVVAAGRSQLLAAPSMMGQCDRPRSRVRCRIPDIQARGQAAPWRSSASSLLSRTSSAPQTRKPDSPSWIRSFRSILAARVQCCEFSSPKINELLLQAALAPNPCPNRCRIGSIHSAGRIPRAEASTTFAVNYDGSMEAEYRSSRHADPVARNGA